MPEGKTGLFLQNGHTVLADNPIHPIVPCYGGGFVVGIPNRNGRNQVIYMDVFPIESGTLLDGIKLKFRENNGFKESGAPIRNLRTLGFILEIIFRQEVLYEVGSLLMGKELIPF